MLDCILTKIYILSKFFGVESCSWKSLERMIFNLWNWDFIFRMRFILKDLESTDIVKKGRYSIFRIYRVFDKFWQSAYVSRAD